MTTEETVWHGPRVLTKVRQVCIPVELLRALNVDVGSELQFALDAEHNEIRIRATGRTRVAADQKRAT